MACATQAPKPNNNKKEGITMTRKTVSELMRERRDNAAQMREYITRMTLKNPAKYYIVGYGRDGAREGGRLYAITVAAADLPDAIALDCIMSVTSADHGCRPCIRFAPLAARVDEIRMSGRAHVVIVPEGRGNRGERAEAVLLREFGIEPNPKPQTGLYAPDGFAHCGWAVQIKSPNATIDIIDGV